MTKGSARCGNCKYWDAADEDENATYYGVPTGTCELQYKYEGKGFVKMWTGYGENTIHTTKDFYCNQWVKK